MAQKQQDNTRDILVKQPDFPFAGGSVLPGKTAIMIFFIHKYPAIYFPLKVHTIHEQE
ncbi:hypothetical protein [Desulfopila sp. IMCC35006]|uniref:hypothetical protein n=1 Tax=Desulfopila sp. IMCC35006 TaxID=2569542 RepID=UPI00129467AB|nr:hypothetical protein [Desulfopila sp. IMCC35006]